MALWESQSIQFAWFLFTSGSVKLHEIFEALTGDEPVNYQRNKVPNPANPFLGIASGPLGDFQANLQLQPGRLDLIITPNQSQNAAHEGPPDFQTLDTIQAISAGLKAIANVADQLPSVRLAVIVNLIRKTSTADEARTILEEVLNFNASFTDYSDLIFQINRRRPLLEIPTISINRLLRYSSATFQSFAIMNFQPGAAPTPVHREEYAAALTVDINTVPDGKVFAPGETITIFNAITTEAIRLGEAKHISALEDQNAKH